VNDIVEVLFYGRDHRLVLREWSKQVMPRHGRTTRVTVRKASSLCQ